ncbi:N-acetylglucosamine-6-sulfatase-like isoform X2 [Galleria mellonella]|uniref:N-acetylglucosamine-6-sulfatase-like isoform X2 n=1 Tax=Galleria mellonella TaxID=7137 RepID=A0A6J1WKA6_GALME|nr:N-acetylglucosamine-6-sulfatase-like isoform X2 [Galleria mellonella]
MLYYLLLFYLTQTVMCEKQPNFVLVLTDDQDVVLGGMNPMKNVRRFIAEEGVTFTNSFVSSPICCPSRASLLTGLYVHNHLTRNNSVAGGCYGENWRQNEHRVFANALKNAGYNTFYAGKYLNEYGVKHAEGPSRVPPGWSEWHGLVGNSVYYNYTISNDGVPTHSTDLYLTDVIREISINYIENQTKSQPFLMVLAPPAPHQPFTPAPRHKGVFSNVTALRQPNFNVVAEDKHWLLRMPPSPLPESMMSELDKAYRSRWEALLAVDEMVADVVQALEINALMEDTYIIFTSDNGYHIGQFSQVYDKRQPYETDIRVPLLIRGPGIKKNTQNPQPVTNIDLAPTILQLAGLEPKKMDGHPLELLKEEDNMERLMLVEYYGEGRDGTVDPKCPWIYDSDHLAECHPLYDCKCQDSKNNTFACIRHIADRVNMKYCLFADNENFAEMYDLSKDPYELENIVNEEFQSIVLWYRNSLVRLLSCKGREECDHVNTKKDSIDTF